MGHFLFTNPGLHPLNTWKEIKAVGSLSVHHQYVSYADGLFTEHGLAPKTMEREATSYAKFNNVNIEDEQSVPYDMIVVQPFTATQDPSALGIKPIPNIDKKISQLIEKYRAESIDIDDIEFEEPDVMDWAEFTEVREDESDA